MKGYLGLKIYGDPKSAGSKTSFKHPHTGAIITKEAVKGSDAWKGMVAQEAGKQLPNGWELLDGPLEVVITFYLPRPRTHYGTGKNDGQVRGGAPSHPATRPDVLKLARGVEDALTKIVWTDDARIVSELLTKCYGEPSRVEIMVTEFTRTMGELARTVGETRGRALQGEAA